MKKLFFVFALGLLLACGGGGDTETSDTTSVTTEPTGTDAGTMGTDTTGGMGTGTMGTDTTGGGM